MKKHIIWLAVLLTFLLISLPAFAKPALPETPPAPPPQTAGELVVPGHTVPVVTGVTVSGDSITIAASGDFDEVEAILELLTPSGFERDYVTFTLQDGVAHWSAPSMPEGDYAWMLISVNLYNGSNPDVSMSYRYNASGTLEGYSIYDDAARIIYRYDGQSVLTGYSTGNLGAKYGPDGSLTEYAFSTKGSTKVYSGQHELLQEEYLDYDTGERIQLRYKGGVVMRRVVSELDGNDYVYDGQGILRESITYDDGSTLTYSLFDTNGNLYSYFVQTDDTQMQYDAVGNLYQKLVKTNITQTVDEYEGGVPVRRTVTTRLLGGDLTIDEYENGVLIMHTISSKDGDSHYDAQGNYLGKTVENGDTEEEYNAAGVMTGYSVHTEQMGGQVQLTYNHRRALQSFTYTDPYFAYVYRYDVKENAWYLNNLPYFGPIPFTVSALVLDKEIVWYPNNTVCSFGPQFRDVAPELTDKWYMFTPIDVSRDGTQTFELVGGSVYVLGQVAVTVAGDSVTVTYKTVRGENGHIYTKSEYLNFFPDLASVKAVNPDEIGDGFKFGQTISISKDLGGDTNVLMFVRNVATFCNFADKYTPLRRYYNNLPSRVEKRNAMLDLMDDYTQP